ncbi:hypothetical protein [Streptomyces sp. NPDC002132]|uniref:hypothetical protein n=1 Tax=unclassified Streptomyces TaxID=2593676 RepID=UPI00331CA130
MTKRIARTADITALEADPGTQEWWKLTEIRPSVRPARPRRPDPAAPDRPDVDPQ